MIQLSPSPTPPNSPPHLHPKFYYLPFQSNSSVAVLICLCVGGIIFGICFVIISCLSILLLVPQEGCVCECAISSVSSFIIFEKVWYGECIHLDRFDDYSTLTEYTIYIFVIKLETFPRIPP